MPDNSVNLVQIGVRYQSLNKGGVKIICHKCFSMKYGPSPRKIHSTQLTILLMVIFTLRNGKQNGKILLYVFLFSVMCVDVYSVSAH